jgi:hypothetical protein
MPYDFDALHIAALALIFVMWGLYGPILNFMGRGTLNAQLHVVRLRWMRMSLNSNREFLLAFWAPWRVSAAYTRHWQGLSFFHQFRLGCLRFTSRH